MDRNRIIDAMHFVRRWLCVRLDDMTLTVVDLVILAIMMIIIKYAL